MPTEGETLQETGSVQQDGYPYRLVDLCGNQRDLVTRHLDSLPIRLRSANRTDIDLGQICGFQDVVKGPCE